MKRKTQSPLSASLSAVSADEQLRQQKNILRYFYDLPFIGMAITSPHTKLWLQFNDQLCMILGYSRAELATLNWVELTHPDDLDKDLAEFDRVMNGLSEGYRLNKRFLRKDGSIVYATIDVRCQRGENSQVQFFIATIQDITEHFMVEEALRHRNRELALQNHTLQQINIGTGLETILVDLVQQIESIHTRVFGSILLLDEKSQRLHVGAAPSLPDTYNRALEGILINDGVGCCGTAAFSGERVIAYDIMTDPHWQNYRHLASEAGLRSCWSQPIKNGDGCILGTFALYQQQPATPSADEIEMIERYANLAAIAIERKQVEKQIERLAFYDTLTQLPNRRLLEDRMAQAMAISKRTQRYCAVMFIDLDNFKPLNDSHGHAAGDLLLQEVAQRLTQCVREMDTVARFGGDEFVLVMTELDTNQADALELARQLAEKIRSTLAEPFTLSMQTPHGGDQQVIHHCTASIGVQMFVNHLSTASDLLKWADAAMYHAKLSGRNRVFFKDETG